MPLLTATPARIRRSLREAEFARISEPAILVARPAAQDGFASVREGFFDDVADAQFLLDELAQELMTNRFHEAIETDTPFRLGQDIPLSPTIPRAEAVDSSTGFSRVMTIKGVAIDLGADRNSIEVVGSEVATPETLLALDDGDGILLLDDDTDGTSGIILG